MENKGYKRQSHLDEYGAVVQKSSRLDSSVNQSDSIESISTSRDDETADIILDAEDINKLTLKSKLSIFKLANNRLKGLENIQDDMTKFGKCIKEELIESGMQYKGDNCDKCKPYHLMHFFQLTKEKDNVTAVQIGEQLENQEGIGDCPGDRRSGNILVFYRLKQNPVNTENSIPEAFFLCQGIGYHFILYLSDPSFRTRVVKRFMDDEKIKEIETLNIAGSDVTSKHIYKDNCNIAAVSFLERAIVRLSGIIVRNSKLDKLIQRDGKKKDISMEVGINFVRICKSLPCEEWAKALPLFSDEVDDEDTGFARPTCHMQNALEYVRRVEDDKKSRELDRAITEKAIDLIANNHPTSSYYLSHRYIRDWSLSSNIILSDIDTAIKLDDWNSAPTLIMVIEAINRHFKTIPSLITQRLKGRKIVLSYGWESGMKNIPVQDFVHGSVSKNGGQYFKIAQKWFFLSSTYSQVVDRNFAYLSQRILLDKCISDLMIYPWHPHKLEITNDDCQKFLGVSTDAGQEILQKLTQGCKLVDEANRCCLTENSYLLPESSELFKDFKELSKKQKGNNTKTREKHQLFTKNHSISGNAKGATMNNLSGNNTPYQDSGIDHASSVASSAPVDSITDTPSSSLDMSLPSTSHRTSGSGLNTLEVDNDNIPYNDSGIGLASSMDLSAPVDSITDTPSSLDMSPPSTSYRTSGSGLNTPQVDNDNMSYHDAGIGLASSMDSSAPGGSITDTPSDMSLPSTSYRTSGIGLNTLEVDNDNIPYNDSGIGLASSMDSSAHVDSITDTPSSLDMSLPSTSYLTSGSGLNIPEVDRDNDQNQTDTSDENSHKKDGVGKMLVQLLTSDGAVKDSGVLSLLRKKKRDICVKKGNKYFVCNPILTQNMMEQIKCIESSLEEPRLSNFLKYMSPLSEGDYNALYLNCDENDDFIIFPGDKVLANNVELFDILVYDKKNHTTYLFQIKEGLDRHTRVACTQIRNASELLWHDFVRGQRTHIELFWESAVYSNTTETPYRYILKRKLREMGKDKFMKMFDDDAKIVFVLGFVILQSKASSKLRWKFKSLTLKDFQEEDLNEHDKTLLESEGILTKSGYLTDDFIGMTQKKFVGKFKSNNRTIARLTKIHKFLSTKGTCDLSTIAKLELLTLDNCFSRYQIGGKRHYHLKALQLDSK